MNKDIEEQVEEIVEQNTEEAKTAVLEYIKNAIDKVTEKKITLENNIKEIEKISDMLQFYIGKETLTVDTIMKVNLLKVHSVNLVSTTVSTYKENLINATKDYKDQIEAIKATLIKLQDQLEEAMKPDDNVEKVDETIEKTD